MEVNLFSFSYEKNITPSKKGGNGIVVLERDLRDIPEPWPAIKTNGRSKEVKEFFQKAKMYLVLSGKWKTVLTALEEEKKILESLITGGVEIGISELNISYGCRGGYQRSVFWSEEIFSWIKKDSIFSSVDVSLKHTAPLMRQK